MEKNLQKRGFLGTRYSYSRKRYVFFFLLLSILGAWLNAQGGWVKDFSYHRTVVLPFLFHNYTTTGFNWYMAGIFDDILGFTTTLIGIYGFKKLAGVEILDLYERRYFLIPVVAYIVADAVAFLNFNNYYTGVTSLSDYGIYWNILQYFILVPAMIMADSLLILYRTKKEVG